MTSLKQYLKSLVTARWFPTVSKPVVSGLFASGIVYGLHAAGITDFTSWEVNNAVAPLVGFLIAAIVTKVEKPAVVGTVQVKTTVATHTASYEPNATLGKTIASTFLEPIANEIDKDPALVNEIAGKALERVLNPAQAAAATELIDGLFKRTTTPVKAPAEPLHGFANPGPDDDVTAMAPAPVPTPFAGEDPVDLSTFHGRGESPTT